MQQAANCQWYWPKILLNNAAPNMIFAENNASGQHDIEEDAAALYNAMKGYGTNEEELINILCNRTAFERQGIAEAYKIKYGKSLVQKLKSELSGKLCDIMVGLARAPADLDAKYLERAIHGLGTDERALIEILCTRTSEEIVAVKAAYKKSCKRDLTEATYDDTSGDFRSLLSALLAASRDDVQTKPVNRNLAKVTANKLFDKGENRWFGVNERYFIDVLTQQSYEQLQLVFSAYRKLTGHSIEDAIERKMSRHLKKGLLAIVKVVRNPAAFFALQLHHYTKDKKFDHDAVIRVMLTRFGKDLNEIRQEYRQHYDEELESVIRRKTTGDERRALLALCTYDANCEARHADECSSSSSSSSSSESEGSSSSDEKRKKKRHSKKHSRKSGGSSKHSTRFGTDDDDLGSDDDKRTAAAVIAQKDSGLGGIGGSRPSSSRNEPQPSSSGRSSGHSHGKSKHHHSAVKSEKVSSKKKSDRKRKDDGSDSDSSSSSSSSSSSDDS